MGELRRQRRDHGERRLIDHGLVTEWSLHEVQPLATTYDGASSVWEARSPTYGRVVVKVGPRGHDSRREVAALKAWAGVGAVGLLAYDPDRRTLLLPRLTPGTALDPEVLDDDTCTRAIVAAASALAVPAGPDELGQLPGLELWLDDLDGHLASYPEDDPIGTEVVLTARETLVRLLESTTERVVLHGDLHHDNVLRHGDEWVVIDPHGYVGDPAVEPGTMLYNPIPYVFGMDQDGMAELVQRRLDLWSTESSLDPVRVRDWAFVKAVIAEVWSAEDSGRDTADARFARLLLPQGS